MEDHCKHRQMLICELKFALQCEYNLIKQIVQKKSKQKINDLF